MNADGQAGFAEWLREQLGSSGWSIKDLAAASGVKEWNVARVLKDPSAKMFERNVRLLAIALHADPDRIAALADYADLTASVPNPRSYASFAEWLAAAMQARRETAAHVSRGVGLTDVAIQSALRGKSVPTRPNLDKLANYFGVPRTELRALKPKAPANIARGKALVERVGLEESRRRLDAVQNRARPLTVEERRDRARAGGLANARQQDVRHFQDMQQKAMESHRQNAELRGSWWTNPEEAVTAQERARANQPLAVAKRRANASQRGSMFRDPERAAALADAQRNGDWLLCLFCGDPDRLIYRSRSRLDRAQGPDGKPSAAIYHRECFEAWRGTQEMRERSREWGTIGWIWSRVSQSGDERLKERIRKQVRAQLEDLKARGRGKRRAVRPSTLLREKDLAIQMALALDVLELSTRQIGELAGFSLSRDVRGNKAASRWTWEMIRLGRVLADLTPADGEDGTSA